MEGVVLQTLSTAFGFCFPRLSLTGAHSRLAWQAGEPPGNSLPPLPQCWDYRYAPVIMGQVNVLSSGAPQTSKPSGGRGRVVRRRAWADLLSHWTFELSLAFFPHWFKQSKQAMETVIPPHRSLRLRSHTWGSGHGQCERLQSCAFWVMVWRNRLILTWQRPWCLPFFHLSFWCVSGAA